MPPINSASSFIEGFEKNTKGVFTILGSEKAGAVGMGIALCLEKALAQSGVVREDVKYINAHATSTLSADVSEYEAIIHCFGYNSELKINSTKSITSHFLGAGGGVEAISTVKALQTGWLHPNMNSENPEVGVVCRHLFVVIELML
ncbi:hypothetical protein L2E82_38173 [Cichorium intybus]|uniref:Uncharacterized protein n=1 Tax=Cichorium intybus TaxID=13427 RepID=A0ACB9AHB0_CICIN|nr:hypothetical protein L2E82_38173 [Cichorium intybus]